MGTLPLNTHTENPMENIFRTSFLNFSKTVKGRTFKGRTFKGRTFKGRTFKGRTFKGKTVRGKTVRGRSFKGKNSGSPPEGQDFQANKTFR